MEFAIEGKMVAPAGGAERDPSKGHHHLIVDGEPIADLEVVPADATHIHYGDGSTKTKVTLSPGHHTLVMQFADGVHRSYGPAWSAKISVDVE